MFYKRNNIQDGIWNNKKKLLPDNSSPCVRNCCLDDEDICVGCFRSIDEIMKWSASDDEQKKQILGKAEVRKKARYNK